MLCSVASVKISRFHDFAALWKWRRLSIKSHDVLCSQEKTHKFYRSSFGMSWLWPLEDIFSTASSGCETRAAEPHCWSYQTWAGWQNCDCDQRAAAPTRILDCTLQELEGQDRVWWSSQGRGNWNSGVFPVKNYFTHGEDKDWDWDDFMAKWLA